MRRTRRMWIPLVLMLVAAPTGVSAATAGPAARARLSVGPNVDVDRAPGNQSEVAVAINPTDPSNIVMVSNVQFGTGLMEAFSFDGGETWTHRVIAKGGNLGAACCDPTLAFDAFGNLFLSYLYDSIYNVVPVALSADGGRTFRVIANVHAPPLPDGSTPATTQEHQGRGRATDQPTVTTGAGTMWVTFNASFAIQAAGATVSGLGAANVSHFSPPEAAPGSRGDPVTQGNYGDVAIGPEGQVMVIYQMPSDGQEPSTIQTNLDPDGLGPAGFGPPTVVATDGAGGFDFIPAQAGRSIDAEAGLAWDATFGPHRGRAYLVYTREAVDESNDMDVVARSSEDGGHTWSPPVRVNDDVTSNSQFMPRIALDPATGSLAVSWYDARNDAGAGGSGDTNGLPDDDAQFFASASVDGGQTWLPNVRVSAGTSNSAGARNGIDFGDYTGLAFFGGTLFPAWADNANTTGDNPGGRLRTLDVLTAAVRLAGA